MLYILSKPYEEAVSNSTLKASITGCGVGGAGVGAGTVGVTAGVADGGGGVGIWTQ